MTSIRIARLRWAGRVQRMNEEDVVFKRIINCTPDGKRGRGRCRLRRIDGILEDDFGLYISYNNKSNKLHKFQYTCAQYIEH